MFPSFLLSLREGLEVSLIIGITLSVLGKVNRQDLRPVVWRGVGSAVIFGLLSAWIFVRLGAQFKGRAEEIFEGFTMLLAAALLTWMIFWMQKRAGTLRAELEADTRSAVAQGGQKALFMLAFLAVAREGLELVLFLAAARLASTFLQTISGALLGLGIAFLLGWLLFRTTARLNLKAFFQLTSLLLIIFAAGLVAHGVHEFNEAGLIPPLVEPVWDVNGFLPEKSFVGQMLATLVGYNANPSLTEVMAYLVYFAALIVGFKMLPHEAQKPVASRSG